MGFSPNTPVTIAVVLWGISVNRVGTGVMVLAIVLSWVPGTPGIGVVPSVVMLGLAAAVGLRRLRPVWLAGATALVAFHMLALRLVPLLWLAAAGLLCYEQLDHRRLGALWRGQRRAVTLGVLLCLLALLLTWSRSPVWAGGYTYGYSPYLRTAAYRWDFAKHYFPGDGRSGRDQRLGLLVEAALLGVGLGLAGPGRARWLGSVGVLALVAVWWLVHLGPYPGPWLFGVGLALTAAGAVRREARKRGP